MKIKFNLENTLYMLALFCATIAMVTGFWQIELPLSLYQASVYFVVLWYGLILYRTVGGKVKLRNTIIFAVYIVTFFFFLFSDKEMDLLKLFTLFCCFAFMHIILQREISAKMGEYFFAVSFIGSLLFISAWLFTEKSYFGVTRTIFGFNPQSVGCWAYILGASLMIYKETVNSRCIKLFLMVIVCFMLYIAIETDTKAAIYAMIVLFVLTTAYPIVNVSNPAVAAFMAIIPAIISLLGVFLYQTGISSELGDKGTLFTGRERIWSEDLKIAAENFFVGDYAEYYNHYSHNVFIGQSLLYGFPMAIFFVSFMGYVLYKMASRIESKTNYTAYIAFIGALLVSSMEELVFSTGCGGVFIYAFSFVFLMGYAPKQKKLRMGKC